MLKKPVKRVISLLSALALVGTSVVAPWGADDSQAAKKARLKTKKISVKVGKKKKIVIKNKVKKAKYTFKSKNKKIATVTKKGVVKGVKAGRTSIVVTEKKKKKKRTVGKVTVKVTKVKKNTDVTPGEDTKTNAPGQSTAPSNPTGSGTPNATPPTGGGSNPAVTNDPNTTGGPATTSGPNTTGGPATTSGPNTTGGPATTSGPNTTGGPVTTSGPNTTNDPHATENPLDPSDSTYDVRWKELPVNEEFDSEEAAVTSEMKDGITEWKTEGGKEGGYAVVKKSEWTGPTVFLDNRFSDTATRFVVSAWIKAESEDGKFKEVNFYQGNKYGEGDTASKYLAGKYGSVASRKLNTEWEQIVKTISVPKNKFLEVRVICPGADFGIDKLEARLLGEGEIEPSMDPEVEEPAPDDALTDTFTMTGDQLKPFEGEGGG